MNFSHGSYEYHGGVITNMRECLVKYPMDGRLCAIALDTKVSRCHRSLRG